MGRVSADYYMTAQEVADEQRLSVETLYHWRKAGTGPRSTKRGSRRIVYKRSDVDAWVTAQEQASARGEQVAS